ncbi:MAG TPA: biopolymer transporter ExbD [Nostocaceae cyanobacterium]|nr:biopolymer transporter ExbD [Nostocaceae cyanobacterium]
MRLPDDPDIPAQINIVPMIDIIFAILTFFVMSSLYLTRSEGLPVNLPQASTAKIDRPAQVTVTINNSGEIFLNKEAISLEQLEVGVKQKVETGKELIVVLNADEAVNHGKVVTVMDKLRGIEGAKLAIATRK